MNEKPKIVIRGTNWLGDSVITIPAVRALRALFPASTISMIAPRNLSGLWECEPSVDRVIPLERPTPPREKLGLVRLLRGERYDLGVIFPNSFESALWFYLGGVRERLGYRTCGRALLLNRGVRPPGPKGHQVHGYLRLVRSLGEVECDPVPVVTLPDEAGPAASGLLLGKGIKSGSRIVVINPGSTYGRAKCWPEAGFSRLARMITERLSARVVVVGGPGERPLVERICGSAGPGAVNLAGETTVIQLAAIIRECSVFVGNDSGPMHLACAVKTPAVVIIGPTDPAATGPLGKNIMVRNEVECAPCLRRECPTDHRCMTGVSVEAVYAAVEEMLGNCKSQIANCKSQVPNRGGGGRGL